ncbi:hypothetical protein POP12_239 [Pectobacterium phage POP12]|nr:hypothetical protein POP12_239 [Pectobacterium phage POP12]
MKQKDLNVIINEAVKHGNKLFQQGDIDFAPTKIDIMVALLLESTKGKLAYRNKEVTDFVVKFEEDCKYAKPIDPVLVEYLHSKF